MAGRVWSRQNHPLSPQRSSSGSVLVTLSTGRCSTNHCSNIVSAQLNIFPTKHADYTDMRSDEKTPACRRIRFAFSVCFVGQIVSSSFDDFLPSRFLVASEQQLVGREENPPWKSEEKVIPCTCLFFIDLHNLSFRNHEKSQQEI